ncbi:MAG: hypothetical protein RIC55_00980 [Pirellulaceae bacterium]
MNTQDRKELHELLAVLVDGSPTGPEQQRLAELLDDAEGRRIYLEYFDLHAELSLASRRAVHLPGTAAAEELRSPAHESETATARRPASRWPRMAVALSGLALALLVVVVWLATSGGQPNTEVRPLARIAEADGARWSPESSAVLASGRLQAGVLQLERGRAKIAMDCGAELTLRGPVRLELLDAKAVRLLSGAVTVDAPDSAVGFRVLTLTADVVDLGTEFNVAVEADGATEVHVARGVVVARSTGSEAVVPILHGEAGRIDVEQGDIVSTRFDATRFEDTPGASTTKNRTVPKDDQQQPYPPLPAGARVVFLGDRVTDRETHLLLINQALSGLPEEARPKLFNQGVSFPLLFEEHHFEEHISAFRPTHAVLEFGCDLATNTGRHLLSEQQFVEALDRLIRRLEDEGVEPIIASGYELQGKFAEAQPVLDRYNAYLRRTARERGYRLADVEERFRRAGGRQELLADNGRWPTFHGHRQIAIEVLAAWGHPDIAVDSTLKPSLLPGVVTQWQYRFKPTDASLDAAAVANLAADDSWKTLTLPLSGDKFARRMADRTHSISYRDRARGFATNLHRDGSHGIEAVATIHSDDDRTAFLNTGATLHSVWINGEKVHSVRGWTGWHAGKQRIPVQLRQGENKIVIEAGSSFFVSLTDERDWALP